VISIRKEAAHFRDMTVCIRNVFGLALGTKYLIVSECRNEPSNKENLMCETFSEAKSEYLYF
jgi:hypothetical protein